jgi:hypothetical protein
LRPPLLALASAADGTSAAILPVRLDSPIVCDAGLDSLGNRTQVQEDPARETSDPSFNQPELSQPIYSPPYWSLGWSEFVARKRAELQFASLVRSAPAARRLAPP